MQFAKRRMNTVKLQNYVVDTDPTTEMDLSTFSNYADQPVEEYDTGLRIIKYETGTEIPISVLVSKSLVLTAIPSVLL